MSQTNQEELLKVTNELTWMLLATLGVCNSLNQSLVQEFFKIDNNPEKVMKLTQDSIYKNVINIGANALSEMTDFGNMVTQYINQMDPQIRDEITKFTKTRITELANWQEDKKFMQSLIKQEKDNESISAPTTHTIQ